MLLTALDDIAWLLNMRGNDIEFNPLFFSYVIFFRDGENFRADLFISKNKVDDPNVQKHLEDNHIAVYEYDQILAKLEEYSG